MKLLSGKHKKPKSRSGKRWSVILSKHNVIPSDAYGTIEFLSGPHSYKAQYIKLAYDTDPAQILYLFEHIWHLASPKLVISIHSGHRNFELPQKLARSFRNGIVKAAKSTTAWIFTPGFDIGVVRHLSAALEPVITTYKAKSKLVSIGIVPWGMLYNKENFMGQDNHIYYHPQGFSDKSRCFELNSRHAYYILVDDGTVGRYGSEVVLRRRLESYIMEKRKLESCCNKSVPVVGITLEGGQSLIRTVQDYATIGPKVPVVICDGSGRASNLLSFVQAHLDSNGKIESRFCQQLLNMTRKTWNVSEDKAQKLIRDLQSIVAHKNLINVFRVDQQESLDYQIAKALYKERNLTAYEQLMLSLAWNRVDIARNEIFSDQADFSTSDLNNVMMEALMQDKVDFIRLLLEKGVNMHKFLTIKKLEALYSSSYQQNDLVKHLACEFLRTPKSYILTLPDIGIIIEKLMRHGFKSRYTTKEFEEQYENYQEKLKEKSVRLNGKNRRHSESIPINLDINRKMMPKYSISLTTQIKLPRQCKSETKIDMKIESSCDSFDESEQEFFEYPFSDLFIWAVLTQRQEMAMCMWEHGDEALAKAIVGMRLYKSLAYHANLLENQVCVDCDELRDYASQFHKKALELLDVCFKSDDANTLQLLTYELSYWGHETCLSLAVLANSKAILAHPCCQTLLADLWHGGLQIRHHVNSKVVLGLLFSPYIFCLNFKSKEELKLQPQTIIEHAEMHSEESSSSSLLDFESTIALTPKLENEVQSLTSKTSFIQKLRGNISRAFSQGSENHDHASKKKLQKSISTTSMSNFRQNVMNFDQNHMVTPKNFDKAQKHKRRKPIDWLRRLYEFYVAPITTFWSWTIKYAIFLMVFIYVLLVKTPENPTAVEWWLLAYVVSYGIELVRRLAISQPMTLKDKLDMFFENFWNTLTTIAVVGFIVGFGFRLMPNVSFSTNLPMSTLSTYHLNLKRDVSRIILALDSVLWVIKILEYLSIHPKFGPYIYAAGKMAMNAIYVVILLCISLLAFGLPRQSISFPNEDWHWLLIRNIFYKPYFMVYGEVYADEIDLCDDEAWEGHLGEGIPLNEFNKTNTIHCVPGYWIPPILMTVFLIVATFLLLSMLIATFNQIFDGVRRTSHQIWLFQRYNQVIQYECTPCIPPPFTPIYYVYMILKYARYRYRCYKGDEKVEERRKRNDRHILFDWSLKLYLSNDQIENLHDFEQECLEEMSKMKESQRCQSTEERVKRTFEKTDAIYSKIGRLENEKHDSYSKLDDLENKIKNLDEKQDRILEYLKKLSNKKDLTQENYLDMDESEEPRRKVSDVIPEFEPQILGEEYEDEMNLPSRKFATSMIKEVEEDEHLEDRQSE